MIKNKNKIKNLRKQSYKIIFIIYCIFSTGHGKFQGTNEVNDLANMVCLLNIKSFGFFGFIVKLTLISDIFQYLI